MAHFEVILPNEVIREFEKIYGNSREIIGAMTRAGVEAVRQQVEKTLPNPKLKEHLHVSGTYRTPSDGGINTKVYLSGYFPFRGNRKTFSFGAYSYTKGVPVPFICNLYEYGRSDGKFPQHQFMRPAFGKKSLIEKAMLDAQKKASGGLLE